MGGRDVAFTSPREGVRVSRLKSPSRGPPRSLLYPLAFCLRDNRAVACIIKIPQNPPKLLWTAVLASLSILAAIIIREARPPSDAAKIPTQPIKPLAMDSQSASAKSPSLRVVYPYSVIPGGVRDAGELLEKIKSDPVVAAHYSGFSAAKARPVAAREATPVHVAYRIGDKVYWTAKKVRLARGETLIADGRNLARGRCGNRVSVLAQEPTSPVEPPAGVLDTPVPPAGPVIAGNPLPAGMETLLDELRSPNALPPLDSPFLSQGSAVPSIWMPGSPIGEDFGGSGSGGSGVSSLPVFSYPGQEGISPGIPAVPITGGGGNSGTSSSVVPASTPPVAPGPSPTSPSVPGSGSQPGTSGSGSEGLNPYIPVIPIPPITPVVPLPPSPGQGPIGGNPPNGDSPPGITPGGLGETPPPIPGPASPGSEIPSVPEADTLVLLGAGLILLLICRKGDSHHCPHR
jgi:hypothetical protein